ncbi:BMP family ABC transporter substrate-binding protein [Bosea sp. SSUT16]|uniref:BMP family ABC transporter substrate-binding protein n=1 Tax=Bosea spartocytisi TaxID=2773451 RepID=A0A927E9N8_9HYPH|nr:BMP family ABC transporter substrate-binding protein [Bosea spartocytisi]MBD3846923.1 BMP family ABC transporter substrate-binding protein [Bosea spartocytisi]MCT4474288.1 BMP family ABC transporter substrate-binding protein [Bosea spartocytisi]
MTAAGISRRSLVLGATTGAAALASAGWPGAAGAADKLVVGVIYVGTRGDFGWNQSHATAVEALKTVPGVSVVEEENVPETLAVANTMKSMIELDGAKLIFGTSFGYFNPFMVDIARQYPDVQLRHPTTLWSADKHPANLGGYFAYMDQAHYVNGVAAGLSSKTGKIGYVAAKPISLVLRTINSFMLGVRKGNPGATVKLIFTGDWSLPVREAEAANALASAGCDVVACHVDSPKVIVETLERRGVKSCGHNTSQAALAPKGFITGAETKYETIYKGFAELLARGEPLPNVAIGGYDKDMVTSTPFGAGASEEARRAATEAIAALRAGQPMFAGPIRDNKGNVIVAPGSALGNYAPELETANYLVEGIEGSVT